MRKPGSSRSSGYVDTQADAIGVAKRILGNDGGGEAVIHRPDGRIRDSDTVSPGNDPFPPKGIGTMADKKPAQVPKPGGGTRDRDRNNDGRWREKRDDAGKKRR